EVPISVLAQVPGLFTSDQALDLDELRRALSEALTEAIEKHNEMRATEGAALAQELGALLRNARALREKIAERGPELGEVYRKRLAERITRLGLDLAGNVEHGRLETEVALLADRSDITEELARLGSHFEQFEALMNQELPVGRRLDFLLQEIAREGNTIGAKCQDALLSHLVVELKAETERMREQVQNVE
ncbi:MAG: hypothetical protein RJA70_2995, partial [Pseudomonadota bacterium]